MQSAESLQQTTEQTLNDLRECVLPFGIKLKPTIESTEKVYQNLPPQTKQFCVDMLTSTLTGIKALSEVASSRLDLEMQMIRMACKGAQLEVPEEFYQLITEKDIIEIYDVSSKNQIYRNLEFLNRSSYDFLTIITHPYTDLFERSEDYGPQIVERSEWVTNHATGPVSWNIPEHYLIEKMSKHRWKYVMRMGVICPVYSTAPETKGQRVAWASTLQVERVGFEKAQAAN